MKDKLTSSTKKTLGLSPGTVVYVGNKRDNELYIDVFDYDQDDVTEKKLSTIDEAFRFIDTKPTSWININGLNHIDAIEKLGLHYQFHPLIIEDIVNTNQRPKIEEYENYIFVALKMLYFDKNENLSIEHLSFILGNNYTISFQETDGDVFDPIRQRLRTKKGKIRSMGSDYLLYCLMDAVVDNYYNLIETLGEKIETLEDSLFKPESDHEITHDIQDLKKEILKVRRAIFPLREVVSRLNKAEHVLLNEKTQLYIRDLYDHIVQISENIEIQREMVWGLMDMYMSTISNKMNEVMKVLTIIATIFIPLTFIAGIYGMNFKHIPELNYQYGYFILWGVMIIIFITMLYYFKKKKWL